jgi:hypothetical protein
LLSNNSVNNGLNEAIAATVAFEKIEEQRIAFFLKRRGKRTTSDGSHYQRTGESE